MTKSPDATAVEAIVFDAFGTVVDWRGSIVRDLSTWSVDQGLDVDWARLANAWRGRYDMQMERVRSGRISWTKLDELHYAALCDALVEFELTHLTFAQRRHVNEVGHRLDGWPDCASGLSRLKRKYIIGPLSNGNVKLLVDMAKHARLPWDAIFSCELFRRYKPHPETYLGVCALLDLAPAHVMMCAAHNDDLAAARAAGLQTAFIARPTEYGPGQTSDLEPAQRWDVIATDLEDLATKMGA
ncbi:MAG: haloacid dehalogenase type II [Candidatus Eremiobacteraeota bacterium]|nr:haloacid dehalogenase type II [Candidatus Eremiobacteraeota bacterium]